MEYGCSRTVATLELTFVPLYLRVYSYLHFFLNLMPDEIFSQCLTNA